MVKEEGGTTKQGVAYRPTIKGIIVGCKKPEARAHNLIRKHE